MDRLNRRPVIVLGIGGHAKVVSDTLLQSGRKILGFVSPNAKPNETFCGFDVLGDDSVIGNYLSDKVILANGVGALPYKASRWDISKKFRSQGYRFAKIVHPSAIIADDVELSEGVQVMAGAVIQPSSRIGFDSIINTGVLLDHDCNIGESCHLAPGVVCSGGVVLAKRVHLGTGTVVIQNISVGENSIIAAGSVIYKNIESDVFFRQKHQLTEKIIMEK